MHLDDVVWHQRRVVGPLLFDRRQVDDNLLPGGRARLLPDDFDLVLLAVLLDASSHRHRARKRDWLPERNCQRRIDIAYYINLVGIGERDDVAGLQIWVGFWVAAQCIAKTIT